MRGRIVWGGGGGARRGRVLARAHQHGLRVHDEVRGPVRGLVPQPPPEQRRAFAAMSECSALWWQPAPRQLRAMQAHATRAASTQRGYARVARVNAGCRRACWHGNYCDPAYSSAGVMSAGLRPASVVYDQVSVHDRYSWARDEETLLRVFFVRNAAATVRSASAAVPAPSAVRSTCLQPRRLAHRVQCRLLHEASLQQLAARVELITNKDAHA